MQVQIAMLKSILCSFICLMFLSSDSCSGGCLGAPEGKSGANCKKGKRNGKTTTLPSNAGKKSATKLNNPNNNGKVEDDLFPNQMSTQDSEQNNIENETNENIENEAKEKNIKRLKNALKGIECTIEDTKEQMEDIKQKIERYNRHPHITYAKNILQKWSHKEPILKKLKEDLLVCMSKIESTEEYKKKIDKELEDAEKS